MGEIAEEGSLFFSLYSFTRGGHIIDDMFNSLRREEAAVKLIPVVCFMINQINFGQIRY